MGCFRTYPTRQPIWDVLDDVYQNQSWTDKEGKWFWVPRHTAPHIIEHNLGFPATVAKIHRFWPWSCRVVKARSQRVDNCSFAVVVKQGEMEQGNPRDQADPWAHPGNKDGQGRHGDERGWQGDEERRPFDNYNRGEDHSRLNSQRGDFKQGGTLVLGKDQEESTAQDLEGSMLGATRDQVISRLLHMMMKEVDTILTIEVKSLIEGV